jgi:pilus assembly protein CpaF
MVDQYQPSPQQTKVLVVDDLVANAELLAEILRDEGYQAIVAHSGRQALEKVASDKPDIVLLDVMMPDIDGFEVCRRIKSNRATLFLPVILVTALSAVEHRVKGAQVGADDFITKPPDERELFTRIRSLSRVQALHRALEASNRQLRDVVQERTQQLEQATEELRKLLAEKAHFSPGLVPDSPVGRPGQAPDALSSPGWTAGGQIVSPPAGGTEGGGGQPTGIDRQAMRDFKRSLFEKLSDSLEGRADLGRTPEIVAMLSERLASIYDASGLRLPNAARQQLFSEILDDILGYGPIEPLLADASITEVMVCGPSLVYVERKGHLSKTPIEFDDDEHVLRVIDRIIRPLARRIDRKSPMVDARLPDGSRVNAIIAPCALDGPAVTIRKFSKERLTVQNLVEFGSLTQEMATFLEACVRSRVNIVVSGGTGSGKTTLLNVLSSFIPAEERIITIEDSAELRLNQEHVVRLEAKPADIDGSGEVPIRQLVKNSLRMRPDRIVVGEVRSGEALDMLQAMNTGHDGSLTTIHANSPRDTIARLETLVLMAGMDLPLKVVRAQIASAVDLIVQQARLRDGSRKVIGITEVQGMEGDMVVLSDIFLFKEKGMQDERVTGELMPTGIRPKFTEKLEVHGFKLPAETFMTRAQLEQMNSLQRR